MKSKEAWKDILGYEGLYKVSDLGRIIAYAKTWESGRWVSRSHLDKEMSYSLDHGGYYVVGLRRTGRQKMFRVHRIVAFMFIPNPENKPEINHINCIKTDNRAVNLEWTTRQENADHAKINGLMPRQCGEKHGAAKLTEAEVLRIRSSNLSDTILSKQFGISRGAIYKIKKGIGWKYLN